MHDRYVRAQTRREKGRLLTEAVQVTGFHRKAVIRVWGRPVRARAGRRRRPGRARRYGPVVVRALKAIWTAAGYPWSVRLKALLPLWVPRARKRLALTPAIEAALLAISARQIDRVLAADKRRIRRHQYGRTKPGTLLKHHIPYQDGSLGRDRARLHRGGPGGALGGLRRRRLSAVAGYDRHPHDVGGNLRGAREKSGARAGGARPVAAAIAVSVARD